MEGPRSLAGSALPLFFSVALNIYFYFQAGPGAGPGVGWSQRATAEAEAVAAISCSGHGRVYLDSLSVDGEQPQCECNTCYAGPDCSQLLPDCPADAYLGEAMFLEPYWQQHAASSAVVFSGWHRMGYHTTGDSIISWELEKHVRQLHAAVGNAVTDGRFIVFGAGAVQLINALVYGLSPDIRNDASASPAKVVAAAPYYPLFREQTELFHFRENEWAGNAYDWVNSSLPKENFIEIVTSPSNPTGRLQDSVLGGPHVITDLAYYWPLYTAIPAPADDDAMIFSLSKMSGHSGSRFGWVLLKDEKVYEKVQNYVHLNSVGASRDTQLRILKVIKTILSEVKGKDDIYEFGHKTMRERWARLNKLVSSSRRFSLQELPSQYCTYFQEIVHPSPAFGWLKCEREEDQDCGSVLSDAGIISSAGVNFGADSRYTRLSLIKTQDDFEQLMQKLEALISSEGHNPM